MKWSEFKEYVDAEINRQSAVDPEIFYIDTGNYPDERTLAVTVAMPDNRLSIS